MRKLLSLVFWDFEVCNINKKINKEQKTDRETFIYTGQNKKHKREHFRRKSMYNKKAKILLLSFIIRFYNNAHKMTDDELHCLHPLAFFRTFYKRKKQHQNMLNKT